MKIFFSALLVIFAVVWLAGALSGVVRQSRTAQRSWLVWLGGCLLIVGVGCFFANALAAEGILPVRSNFEWPVGTDSGVVRGSDGVYAVPLEAVGRVQLYDKNRRFMLGMQVDGEGRNLKVWLSNPGRVEIFTARGRKHFIYSYEGVLLQTKEYSDNFYDLPEGRTESFPMTWWGWPLSTTFHGWCLALGGGLLLWLDKRLSRSKEIAAV
jgi:hypothetical protein